MNTQSIVNQWSVNRMPTVGPQSYREVDRLSTEFPRTIDQLLTKRQPIIKHVLTSV